MKHIVYSLWGQVLFGEDVGAKVTRVDRVVQERILQLQAGGEELVGMVGGLGVVVTRHYHWVLSSGMVNKLVDLVDLAVSLSRVELHVKQVRVSKCEILQQTQVWMYL